MRPQQSYRTTQTAQKGEPPPSRALHLEKVTLAAEVSLTEEAREDVRRRALPEDPGPSEDESALRETKPTQTVQTTCVQQAALAGFVNLNGGLLTYCYWFVHFTRLAGTAGSGAHSEP